MNFSYKVKRFFRNFEIENLMTYIAASMAIVFVGDMLTNGLMSSYLSFSRSAILEGQVWRLLTFLFIPQTNSVVWIIFSVYFYYITGKETEMAWGAHNLFSDGNAAAYRRWLHCGSGFKQLSAVLTVPCVCLFISRNGISDVLCGTHQSKVAGAYRHCFYAGILR